MSLVKDSIMEKIKVLYELGDGGQYEIIHNTIFVIKGCLAMGLSSKSCVDRMMDKGVKPFELGIALVIAMTRTNPSLLSGIDSSLRIKFLRENGKLIADFEELEKQSEF